MISLKVILLLVVAYFIGNISPSTLLARAKGIDIKKSGSGNAGTTNTIRVLGWKAGLFTLIIDVSKGTLAVLLVYYVSQSDTLAAWSALAVFIGHVWPVLFKFKGGKGVATAFGAVLAINWQIALVCLGVVIAVVLIFKMVSLGSVLIAVSFPWICFFFEKSLLYPGIIIAVILLFKHKDNIKRLIDGKENKLNFKKVKDE